MCGREMILHEATTANIRDTTRCIWTFGIARAVLGHVELGHHVFERDARENFEQTIRINFPTHLGPFRCWREHHGLWMIALFRNAITPAHGSIVVIDT